MKTRQRTSDKLVHLTSVNWKSYSKMRRLFANRSGVRMTYDRGELEIFTLAFDHELQADFLGCLVRTLTFELGLPVLGGGSLTLKYKKKKRGLEPDRCFWVANESKMRGVEKFDVRIHPPPDLAIEVDIASSSIDRMSIYAKLGVPEVWRLKGDKLTFNALQPDGNYVTVSNSLSFPKVTAADIFRFLSMTDTTEQNAIVRQFRKWIHSWNKP